jgi:hypothetical protein
VFLVSVPVAFLSPAAAEIMWGIVALTRGLVRRPIQAPSLVGGPRRRSRFHVLCCVPRETLWRGLVVARRNLTVQLDEETIREVKILAAKRGTSISGLVARELELLVARDARYEEAQRRAVELMAQAVEHGGRSWRREDLHQDEGPWSALR